MKTNKVEKWGGRYLSKYPKKNPQKIINSAIINLTFPNNFIGDIWWGEWLFEDWKLKKRLNKIIIYNATINNGKLLCDNK